jgi:phosphate acetyltransferase
MDIVASFLEKSKQLTSRIVLPEAHDDRIIDAAKRLSTEKIARLVLLGNFEALQAKGLVIDGEWIRVIDPTNETTLNRLTDRYFEKRKAKGMTRELAMSTLKDKPHFMGALLVDEGSAEGMVCGADCTTAETLRAAIQCVGSNPKSSIISSFFVMKTNNPVMGKDGALFFADCGVNPDPNADQLASIAMDTAISYIQLMNDEPRVGLLSFSTLGSAEHLLVNKVREALAIVREKSPFLAIDGEFQFDAAVMPDVAERKAPNSAVAGRVNCLIFPNLEAGNIGYKIAERIGNAKAIGPILQGTRKPVNDLSRGCSVDDIVYVTAITVLQANP